jgi:Fe-S cluster biogenesis protein NfuA
MSAPTDADTDPATVDEDDLRERIDRFVMRNFPQIGMHGGSYAIEHLDVEERSVTIALGGACSGCGISPMTIQALKVRLAREIPEIDTVHADSGGVGIGDPGAHGFDRDDVPF